MKQKMRFGELYKIIEINLYEDGWPENSSKVLAPGIYLSTRQSEIFGTVHNFFWNGSNEPFMASLYEFERIS